MFALKVLSCKFYEESIVGSKIRTTKLETWQFFILNFKGTPSLIFKGTPSREEHKGGWYPGTREGGGRRPGAEQVPTIFSGLS
jgi:hypothetical protein